MGMNLSQLQRFMGRVDQTLTDLFPATITIGEDEYACTCVGGDASLQYLEDGGQAPAGMRFFRLSKADLATRPETGTLVTWDASPTGETEFTVMDSPDRPHETSWVLRCAPKNR